MPDDFTQPFRLRDANHIGLKMSKLILSKVIDRKKLRHHAFVTTT